MQPFEWSIPGRIVFGAGQLQRLSKFIRGLGKRAFIVTSPSFVAAGSRAKILGSVLETMKSLGIETEIFSEIEPNPTTATIDRAAAKARSFRPRFVLALGGGSVMDSAKCVALLCENDGEIYSYAYRGPTQTEAMRSFQSALPIACVPTVAATGSEANSYAVVTNPELHRKVAVFGRALHPTVSVVDPELTFSLSASQSSDGAFDMVAHLTETYFSAPPDPVLDEVTEALVRSVFGALPRVLKDPFDLEARTTLSYCSTVALCGLLSGRNGGWPLHAIEHGLSAWRPQISHGRGLALLYPRLLAFNAEVVPDRVIRYNRSIFGLQESLENTPAGAKKALDAGLVPFMKSVGAWTCLADLGIASGQAGSIAEQIADHALETNGIWKRGQDPYLENIRPISRQDCLNLILACQA